MFDQAQKLRELTGVPVKKQEFSTPIISVTSGKGGTGKSLVSFYLSQFLAAQGFKTLLIESDFNLSALSVHLNIKPCATVFDLFTGSALFEEVQTEVSDNLSIIFGDNGKLDFPDNRMGHIRNMFNLIYDRAQEYDIIIIDNGAGIGNEVMEIIRNSTMNLIITLPDTVAIMDAYVVVKMMLKNSITIPMGIIINKCTSEKEGVEAFENLNSASSHFFDKQLELIGTIEENRQFKDVQLLNLDPSKTLPNQAVFNMINSAASRLASFTHLANNRQL